MLKLKIPPPIYALLTVFLMWIFNGNFPIASLFQGAWGMLGWFFIAVGILIELWSVKLFLQEKTTINPLSPNKSKRIVESGIYKYSRNPMYLGMLSILLGCGVLFGSVSALLCLPIFVLVITTQQIIPEEMILTSNFGQVYLDYKKRVRRWL